METTEERVVGPTAPTKTIHPVTELINRFATDLRAAIRAIPDEETAKSIPGFFVVILGEEDAISLGNNLSVPLIIGGLEIAKLNVHATGNEEKRKSPLLEILSKLERATQSQKDGDTTEG